MFNFNLNFNKAPKQQSSSGEFHREMTEDEKEFWVALGEAENQVAEIEEAFKNGMKLEDLKKMTEKLSTLIQYLKTTTHYIPENLLRDDEYARFVDEYDDAVRHIKDFHTEKELKHYLEEIHTVAHPPHAA